MDNGHYRYVEPDIRKSSVTHECAHRYTYTHALTYIHTFKHTYKAMYTIHHIFIYWELMTNCIRYKKIK